MTQQEDREEQLAELKGLVEVLSAMTHVERVPMSRACDDILDALEGAKDPLVNVADAVGSPFLKASQKKHKWICC